MRHSRLIPLVLFALVAASCGSGSDSATTETNADSPAEAPAESEPAVPVEPAETEAPAQTDPPIAEAQTITSDDGLVSLGVPEGAVPAETGITIEAIDAPDGTTAAYEFGPDGLKFAEPATLTWNAEMADGEVGSPLNPVRLAFIDDDGTFTPLGDLTADLSDSGMVLTGSVEHFTTFVLESELSVTVEQTFPVAPVETGETFTFAIAVTALNGGQFEGIEEAYAAFAMTTGSEPSLLTVPCVPEGELEVRGLALVGTPLSAFFAPMTYRATCSTLPVLTELGLTALADGTQLIEGPISFGPAEGGGLTISYPSNIVPEGGSFAVIWNEVSMRYALSCIDDRRSSGMHRCELNDFRGGLQGDIPIEIDTVNGTTFMTVPAGVLDTSGEELVIVLAAMNLPVGQIIIDTLDTGGVGVRTAAETPLDDFDELIRSF